MKKTFLRLPALALIALIIAGSLSAISSCSKSDNPNAQFLGTYPGILTTVGAGTSPDTIVVSTGSSTSGVTLLERKNGVTFTGTVSGNTLTIPQQTVSTALGSYPGSGTGAISGNTLSINYSLTITGVGTVNYTFSGTK